MEWADIDMALDAFVLGNHQTLFAKSMLCPRIAVGNLVSIFLLCICFSPFNPLSLLASPSILVYR